MDYAYKDEYTKSYAADYKKRNTIPPYKACDYKCYTCYKQKKSYKTKSAVYF